MSNLSISIVGAGKIVHEHIKTIQQIDSLEIDGVFSRTKEKSIAISSQYKCRTCRSIEDLVSSSPSGIIVAVSPDQTFQVLKSLIPLKIPLLIEKPPALSLHEAKELVDLSSKHKTLNIVGLNRRFMSHFFEGMEIIKKFGILRGILIEGHERLWQLEDQVDQNILNKWIFANSIHTVDLIRFFGGDPEEQISFNSSSDNKLVDQYSSIFKLKNNLLATYISYWKSPGSWSVKLFGDKVTVVFDPLEKGFWIDENFKKHEIISSQEDKRFKPGFYKQMKAFQNLITSHELEWPAQDLFGAYRTMTIANKMVSKN